MIKSVWDDNPVDVSTEVNFIWSIANKLRGTYRSEKYKDVIIPMVILRRLECALIPTKAKVLDKIKDSPSLPEKILFNLTGYSFYNKSPYDLTKLLDDSDNIADN